MSDSKHGNPIPQLLVTEAIRQLQNKYDGMTDRDKHVYAQVFNLGKKPGFAMASQLCRSGLDYETAEDACKFISTKFSLAVFGVQAKLNFNGSEKTFQLQFTDKLPSWFGSLVVPGKQNQQHDFWIKAYAHFLSGVYSGALLHFGYKSTLDNAFEEKAGKPFCLGFHFEELTGTWEFSSNY
ncbi:hypothetical protein GPJ56_009722 [Histomonas meleagridis]|uniref:uncharacterized protein n=1 Tax=Histomonas meleagridis TaxID=135588 RepID=UPI00355992AB|nr:hypothetical protein GPJ56_009722 [Histomonas meleagridis]KAH0802284.1 hypothetical protein GO595_004897 [Histomonas meleagridis]